MLEAPTPELASIEDPRCAWKVERRLIDILAIAVRAVRGGAETFEDVAPCGRRERGWPGGFLALPSGIPSHGTFRRVLALIDPEAFERRFLGRARAVFRPEGGASRQVATDGETVRRPFGRRKGRSPLRLASAYATGHGLVRAQRAAPRARAASRRRPCPSCAGRPRPARLAAWRAWTRPPAGPGSRSASWRRASWRRAATACPRSRAAGARRPPR